MQSRLGTVNPEYIKERLRRYKENEVELNEPHFSLKLQEEKIDLNEVIRNLLNPEKLVLVGVSASKNRNYEQVYDLHFKVGRNRIFKIPASLRPKSLYLITIFKIRRKIQHEADKYYKKGIFAKKPWFPI